MIPRGQHGQRTRGTDPRVLLQLSPALWEGRTGADKLLLGILLISYGVDMLMCLGLGTKEFA